MPLRKAGDEFWASLKQADETKRKLENLRKNFKDLEDKVAKSEEIKKKHEAEVEAAGEEGEKPEEPEGILTEEEIE